MLAPRYIRLAVSALAVACLSPSLAGEIRARRIYHGKEVECVYGGAALSNPVRSCGTRGYDRVFTASVASVTQMSDEEDLLTLVPDEVFLGDTVGETTATVNQACLLNGPEIKVGDQWLFYLRRDHADPSSHELRLPVEGPSKPLSDAQDEIAALRHLAQDADSAVLLGKVDHIGETYDHPNRQPLANHKMIATNLDSGSDYTAVTDSSGRYKFELPPGNYVLNSDTEHGLMELEGFFPRPTILLQNGGCASTDVTLLTDGKLAGRLTTASGKPASFAKVDIVPIDPVRPQFSIETDSHGHFEVTGRQPGSYLIGVGLLASYSSREWKSRVYYPGVRMREQATIIKLADGEWRTNIDFKIP